MKALDNVEQESATEFGSAVTSMGGIMKNMLILSILFAVQASATFAGEAGLVLGDEASERLKASARQVIQVGVDSEIAGEMTRVLLLNGFNDEQVLRAHAILIKAQRAGLPLQPIVNKAFEGIAKQVSQDTVLIAMDAVLSRYDFAYSRASELSTRSDQKSRLGQALAAGIAAGVSLEDTDAMAGPDLRETAVARMDPAAGDLAAQEEGQAAVLVAVVVGEAAVGVDKAVYRATGY